MAEIVEAVERDVAVIAALHAFAPDEVARDFPGGETCILSSRVGFDVLKHYKIKVRAIPTRVAVYNEAMVSRIGREGRFPVDHAETDRWSTQDGSWGLGIGNTGRITDNRYDGHLVLLVHSIQDPEDDVAGLLMDLSIHQASRPQRHIVLEPLVASVTPAFLKCEEPLLCYQHMCVIRYGFFPESTDWAMTKDWGDLDRRAPIIERLKRRIDIALAEKGLLDA